MRISIAKKVFLGLIVVSLCLVSFFLQSKVEAADKVIKWRMQMLWDPGTSPAKVEERFIKRVEEVTNGRLKIKLFTPGQLVPTNQMLEAVQKGMFEITKQYSGYDIGRLPHTAFTSSLPCGFLEPWQMEVWFWKKGVIDMLREKYASLGVYYLGPTVYSEEPIHSKIPMRTIEDMKGKKGRFVGAAGQFMNALGARVTPLATAEVYSALERGVIDFADRGGLAANYDIGIYEVAKYIVLPGIHQPVTATYYGVNLKAWNKLPKDIQAQLQCAAREAAADMFQTDLSDGKEAIQKYKKKGVEIIYLSNEEVMKARKVAKGLWDTWAAEDPFAKKVYASMIAWMKEIELIQ
jgi:TRAP-type mannitol/chloroaromatic compound transport system substrate-binding protein